ncbi:MAG TPA: hypothetical protein VH370_17915 [Humisphaera sp.]|nr:hypothetical protein [Humisphaera sp.]
MTLKDGFRMTIQSPTHGIAWLTTFKDARKAMDALARELDLYVPELWHTGHGGIASVEGKPLKNGDIARVDLFVKGDASTFEPTQAAHDLATAIKSGDAAGVRAALAAGADVRYLPDDDTSPLEQAIWLGSPYLEGGRYGKVSREQQLDVMTALLKAGANPNAPGQNPAIHNVLHWADTANSSDQLTTVCLLRLLLDHGADPDALGTEMLSAGQRPLHVLVWKHQPLAVIKLLVSHGADAKLPNHAGRTPRQHAEARLQYVSGSLAKLPPAARAPAAAGTDPVLDQTSSFVRMITSDKAPEKKQVLSGMFANLQKISAQESSSEVERLEAAITFLAAAERGEADVSDIDQLAEASWQAHLKEQKEREVQKSAALGMLLKGRESLHQKLAEHLGNLGGGDDE